MPCPQTGENFTSLFSLIGFLCLLKALKVFRYLSISKKMSSLWLTLSRASVDLLSFGLGCVCHSPFTAARNAVDVM